MSKVRVHELARELQVESKVLLTRLKQLGAKVLSHQSTLTDQQVNDLKSAFGSSKTAAPAAAGAKATSETTGGARPRVVIRRRKANEPGDDEPTASEAAPAPVVEEPQVAPPVQARTIEATPPKPVAAPVAPAPVPEPEVALVEAAPEEPVELQAPAASTLPEVEPEERGDALKPVAKRREVGGATIVRRATPEEIEKIESANTKRQTGRKEDHRGTRVTGLGLLSNRVSNVNEEAAAAKQSGAAAAPTEEWAARRPSTDKDRPEGEDEEQIAKRKAAAKARRANMALTTRALLTQAEILTSDEEIADVPSPAAGARTVYMPTAPRQRRDHKRRKDLKKTQMTTPRQAYRVVAMSETITVGELAKQMAIKATEIIKKLMTQGVMATINQALDVDTATLIASEYGFEVKSQVETVDDILKKAAPVEGDFVTRPPIVTVMGHVDHGKTSILDAIRRENVAGGEAGGITQHIGAYQVEHNGEKITFLDTPGHEAFSSMRARGAKVTDIVVLVVAADDGVMPQTIEAISHAKAANVPIIVAVNKIDKPNTNVDRIYTELTEHGVQAEEWGGETQFIKCSALQKLGLDDLLDAILLQAEVLDLRTTPVGRAEGAVIEAHLDKGRGPVATIVVQSGSLSVGDFVVAGSEFGRVRAMVDHNGKEVQTAGPSTPVRIIGLSGVPMAGDQVNAVEDERIAREAAEWRLERTRAAASGKSSAASLEDLLNRVQHDEVPEVPFIIKADTQGSLEAVSESVQKLSTTKVKNRIVHAAVGGVTESDITLGAATGAIIVAFNVRAGRGLDEVAEKAGVMVRYFSIIYEIVDVVKSIMVGKLPPIVNEVIVGRAEVRKTISVPKFGTIAGSAVVDGKIVRSAQLRLIRDSIVIYSGKLSSLRRFKDDVKEVAQGYECGIGIEGYNDLKEGDVIEAFVFEETAATL